MRYWPNSYSLQRSCLVASENPAYFPLLAKLSDTFFCAMLGAVCANSLRTFFFSASVKGMVPALLVLGPRFGQHGLGTEYSFLLLSRAGREMSTVHHTLDRAPPPLLPVHRKPGLLIRATNRRTWEARSAVSAMQCITPLDRCTPPGILVTHTLPVSDCSYLGSATMPWRRHKSRPDRKGPQ